MVSKRQGAVDRGMSHRRKNQGGLFMIDLRLPVPVPPVVIRAEPDRL